MLLELSRGRVRWRQETPGSVTCRARASADGCRFSAFAALECGRGMLNLVVLFLFPQEELEIPAFR